MGLMHRPPQTLSSEQMSGGSPASQRPGRVQAVIDFFQGAEEPHKRLRQFRGPATCCAKIAGPEAVRAGDRGRPHGTVFVGALGPDHTALIVHPDGKTHAFSVRQVCR